MIEIHYYLVVATDIRAKVRPQALIPSSIYCFIEVPFSFFISLFNDNYYVILYISDSCPRFMKWIIHNLYYKYRKVYTVWPITHGTCVIIIIPSVTYRIVLHNFLLFVSISILFFKWEIQKLVSVFGCS